MSESMTAVRPRPVWLIITTIGVSLIVLAMLVVALVIFDKPHFGWLVGWTFLPIITSGVIAGSIVLVIGAWNLPERKSWRGILLLVWALVALTSPAFGIMFLLPWSLLALSLPFVVAILIALFRRRRESFVVST
jgi:hypothetical protein